MRNSARLFFIFLFSLISAKVSASIVIIGTRVIYPSDAREVSVRLNNNGEKPVLVQSWIDRGKDNEESESIPFIVTPPVYRVESGKGQSLRIRQTNPALPADKESVFWFNVLEIPANYQAQPEENYLQIAFRSRIKLFYRPAGLQGDPDDAVKKLLWTAGGNQITASNPTPYHTSLVTLSVNGKQVEGEMISPYSTLTFIVPGKKGETLHGEYVNDYGAINTFDAVLN